MTQEHTNIDGRVVPPRRRTVRAIMEVTRDISLHSRTCKNGGGFCAQGFVPVGVKVLHKYVARSIQHNLKSLARIFCVKAILIVPRPAMHASCAQCRASETCSQKTCGVLMLGIATRHIQLSSSLGLFGNIRRRRPHSDAFVDTVAQPIATL